MGSTCIDTLSISPKYTSEDWEALNQNSEDDLAIAATIVKDRLEGRFLRYATNCLKSPHSGFVVLSIDSLLLETIQQYREGITDGRNQSRTLVTTFLSGKHFQPEFTEDARNAFYNDIRCGLLHQAEAREMWLIRRDQEHLLQEFPGGGGFIIDVKRFHRALQNSFNYYLEELQKPQNNGLRKNLWAKMSLICNVRNQRGAFFGEIT